MKKNLFSLFVGALAVCALTLTSCNDNNDGNPSTPDSEQNLAGGITGTRTLDADTAYTLTGPVIVEDGGVLNIPAGTTIKAQPSFNSYILVLVGGVINIRGTAEAPVRITSAAASPKAGDWGGLIINGCAPLVGGTRGETEISKQFLYGPIDGHPVNAADNSGTIEYLILEYTGNRSTADVEHNGLTLNGVGNGTTIRNIFIVDGSDDGIEFFGGSVNVENLLVVNPDDDMFDFTQGYSGELKNAYGIWEASHTSIEADPRGVEADGNLDGLNPEYAGQSNFKLTNVTFDLRVAYLSGTLTFAAGTVTSAMQDVLKIRRSAQATITNALVKGTGRVQDMIDISDGSQEAPYATTISITNGLTTAPDRPLNPAAYSGVTLATGNTGCPTDIFAWTGYQF
ncbi:MAG: hypothetical protein LBR57_02225 [Alistipes sp.]|jgi:hypothetical protein|nr:hypothetical protein [Alistipes sp.]